RGAGRAGRARSGRRGSAPRGDHARAVQVGRGGAAGRRELRVTSAPTTARPQLAHALRAFPTLFRVGLAEMIAYRAEFVIWILTTNMPLVMMALWTAVASEGAVGRF